MPVVKILRLSFKPIPALTTVSNFRSFVAQKAGYENEVFHNHNIQLGGFHYRYPVLQYQAEFKAGYTNLYITAIGNGIEEIHKLMTHPDLEITIEKEKHKLFINKLNIQEYNFEQSIELIEYHLKNWFAFNEENHKKWQKTILLSDKIDFLEKLIVSNILSMSKGLGITINDKIEVKLISYNDRNLVDFKGKKMILLAANFYCNYIIPDGLRLGKSVSLGFGILKSASKKKIICKQ